MNEINAERLKERMQAARMGQTELARLVGVTQPAIYKLMNGGSRGSTHLHEIARLLGTTPSYLTNQTDDASEGALPRPTPALIAEQLDIVEIPMIDLQFGMGAGTFADSVVEAEKIGFARSFIRRYTSAPIDKIIYASGIGDSMYPTIHSRDGLFIDTSQQELRMGDQIWALYHYGMGMVKRITPTADGYKLASDNPNVENIIVTDGAMQIVGRVVGFVRGL